MNPSNYFTKAQKIAIVDAIREAERNTSGEIRVHIERRAKQPVLDRATQVFADLKMHRTALRNGVLLYLALDDHKLAILGDAGINARVPAGFWDGTTARLVQRFRAGEACEGICEAIRSVGQQLKSYFPHQADDINELPDDISFGNDK